MAEYSEYKDSGQQWLGMVPSHWKVVKIRGVLDENSQQNFAHKISNQLQFKFGTIIPKKLNYDSEDADWSIIEKYIIVSQNDIVINGLNLNYDLLSLRVGLVKEEGIITSAYIVVRPKDGYNPAYLNYAFKGWDSRKLFHGMGTGVRITLSWKELKNYSIPIPPKEEQEAIVAYLDKVTADIDKAIAAKERIIASLEERRKIIITHAVTHGINPDAPMKDSDIDWLGEIPAHWESYPVRHFFDFRNGYTPSKANNSFWTNGTIPWFRMEDIRKSGRFLDKAIQYITPSALNNGGTFEAGSYILAICTASIGEHAMLIADSLANQRFANLKIRKSLSDRTDAMFIFYYLYVLGQYCKDTANTTTFQYADMTQVKNFLVPLPSLDEQHEIVKYLEYNTKGIDTAIAQQKRLIDLLRERKNIIINETVTGKVKVI